MEIVRESAVSMHAHMCVVGSIGSGQRCWND